ncbi:hypothetical protein [Sphingomonas bacterium]|uniref:hypothetical protein n=1 Tax=Sphingomonas bacterium TaxID=1895847 RepID=UPI0015765FDB|nr:hypothetical protein [Sphingomonas bacterium]
MPYIADIRIVSDATDLIASFGAQAGVEAAERADRSRDIGNHIRFCHWRQTERLIVVMTASRAIGTVH